MWGLPINASAHGHEIDFIILLIHIICAVLFVGWALYFIVVLLRFNRRVNPKADYRGVRSHFSSVIEIAVIVVEVILLVGFSIPFWAKQVDAFPNRPDQIEVRVVAEQFAWNIHYPGEDGVFGRTDPSLIDNATNPVGVDLNDPHAQDDIVTINQLHLPIGRPALLHLSSKDVIHSFFLPIMRVKQDMIPGMQISTWFTPTKTGESEIACAQLCGLGHYRMRGFMTIHSEEGYRDWLDSQATLGSSSSEEEEYDDFWN